MEATMVHNMPSLSLYKNVCALLAVSNATIKCTQELSLSMFFHQQKNMSGINHDSNRNTT